MTPDISDPDDLVALGAFVGAQVLVVVFCVIKANAFRERAYLLHAASTMMGVLAVQTLAGRQPYYPQAVMLLVFAFAGWQLRELMGHVGSLARLRKVLLAASLVLIPALAFAAALSMWFFALGVGLWAALAGLMLKRGWRQSQPWVWWLVPGLSSLAAAGAGLGWRGVGRVHEAAVPIAGLLTVWAACLYLATGMRGRMLGQAQARIEARNTIDPQTGLSMPMVLTERLHAARTMMQRYGHPSVLMLVHIENLRRLTEEFGPECAEQVVLAAANRVRESLREGDVAARITQSRIAVLAEGVAPAEGAANIASRILVAGLKEPLPGMPAEFLHFRIALTPVPTTDIPAKLLLQRLDARLEQELHAPGERRILTLAHEELAA